MPKKLDNRVSIALLILYNIDNRTSHASAERHADQGWSVFK